MPFRDKRSLPTTPPGRIIYAVGDVHGCASLLERLIAAIDADASRVSGHEPPVLLFVGDYIDRGPDSRAVVERVIRLKSAGRYEVRALKGNHEEVALEFLRDASVGATWAEYGGVQTLVSYGVNPPLLRTRVGDWDAAQASFAEALPAEHLSFMTSLELSARYGDYLFVHAGIRPGVPLANQNDHDLLWIRDAFLRAPGPHEAVIVHGHTPEADPFLGRQRIGIDTGAYATGVLTAVRLAGSECSVLQVRGK